MIEHHASYLQLKAVIQCHVKSSVASYNDRFPIDVTPGPYPILKEEISGVAQGIVISVNHADLGTTESKYQYMINAFIPQMHYHVNGTLISFIPSSLSDGNESCVSQSLTTAIPHPLFGHEPSHILSNISYLTKNPIKASIVQYLSEIMPNKVWSENKQINQTLEDYLTNFYSNINNEIQQNYNDFTLLRSGLSTYQYFLYMEQDYYDHELNIVFWRLFKTILHNEKPMILNNIHPILRKKTLSSNICRGLTNISILNKHCINARFSTLRVFNKLNKSRFPRVTYRIHKRYMQRSGPIIRSLTPTIPSSWGMRFFIGGNLKPAASTPPVKQTDLNTKHKTVFGLYCQKKIVHNIIVQIPIVLNNVLLISNLRHHLLKQL